MTSLSLILPCFNEMNSLEFLAERTIIAAKVHGFNEKSFQLIMVNNGSTDQSAKVFEKIKQKEFGNYIQVVNIVNNEGYGNGLFQGLKASQSEYVAWSHADEQCDPNDVFKAFETLQNNNNSKQLFIKGSRITKRTLSETMISRMFEMIASILFLTFVHEINAQPKLFHRSLISQFINPPKDFAFDLYVILKSKKAKLEMIEIPVEFPSRKHGQSSWATTLRSKIRTISRFIKFMIMYRFRLGFE